MLANPENESPMEQSNGTRWERPDAPLGTLVYRAGLLSKEKLEAPQFHMFYGFVAIIAVAIIYSYRAQMAKYRYLLYGFGGLFLMGLGIRAMEVGNRAIGG